jgi:hypothetical protein
MRLGGPRTSFELQLLGRPDCEDWCKVRFDADTPQGRWSKTDRCLRAAEVSRLADWLDGTVAAPEEPCGFTEPYLRFSFPGGDRSRLRVHFEFDFRPRWAEDSEEAYYVEFPVNEKVLRRAAEALRAQLTQGRKAMPPRRGG